MLNDLHTDTHILFIIHILGDFIMKQVLVPETGNVNFRQDTTNDEKIIFFSEDSIDRAVRENRIPSDIAPDLKEVLQRKGEIAVIYEWQGMEKYKQKKQSQAISEISLLQQGVHPLRFGH